MATNKLDICPRCGEIYNISVATDSLGNQTLRCNRCGTYISVPARGDDPLEIVRHGLQQMKEQRRSK